MDIKTATASGLFKALAELEYVDLGDNLAVYRLQRSREPVGVVNPLLGVTAGETRYEGFTALAALQRFAAGKAEFPASEPFCLTVPTFLPNVARHGFGLGWKQTVQALPEVYREHPWEPHPYAAIVEQGMSLDTLVRLDEGAHRVFDRAGEALPVAVYYDYIRAKMTDGAYDLEKALAILKQHPRVHFLDARGNETADGSILAVPYYNARQWSSAYLHFRFEPSHEEARQLWQQQMAYGRKDPSTDSSYRAMFDLDLLGLRAGGAAYYDEWGLSREYDKRYAESEDEE